MAPKMGLLFLKKEKYRNNLRSRFGYGFPSVDKKGRKLLWVHAVSLGETKAVAGLVKKIRHKYPDLIILCSSVTETGHAEAKKTMPEADYHVYLPLDFSWIIRPIVESVRPDIVIISETDFWYNFLHASKKAGASICLVNGKLSERSLRRHLWLPCFGRKIFSLIDKFCLQSTHYKERYVKLGIDEEKLSVTGNMKLDGLSDSRGGLSREELGVPENAPLIVAGSTHAPEEQALLVVMKEVWSQIPDARLALVPRHPERFEEVVKLLQKENVAFSRYTKRMSPQQEKIVLVDAIGVLNSCYAIADVAVVAGSYTDKVGGHNIVEPSAFGVPVIFGPHMHTQPELVELVKDYRAGYQAGLKELPEVIVRVLNCPAEQKSLGEAGKRLIEEQRGATEKTLAEIFSKKKEKNPWH